MQCPGLNSLETSLEIFTFLLMLSIVIGIIYFLVKNFNKSIKLKVFLKVILLYYLCAVILYSIFEIFTFTSSFIILKFLIFSIILFIVFYFINRKEFSVNWKKSLVVFLLMSFILFPVLDYIRTLIELKILTMPFFEKQKVQWESKDIQTMLYCSDHLPLHIKIIGNIEGGIASWSGGYLREIIVLIQLR